MQIIDKPKIFSLLARVGTWLLLLGVVYLLRSFFLLVFLTFVFGFIQARGVDKLYRRIPNRAARSWIVGLLLLGILSLIVLFITPSIKTQTMLFVKNFDSYTKTLDKGLYNLATDYPLLDDAIASLTRVDGENATQGDVSPTLALVQQFLGFQDMDQGPDGMGGLLPQIVHLSGKVVGIASAFLLSLLFSFLIVLDLPNLTRAVGSLKHSKLRFVYQEVAPSVYDFSRILGRALEAQFFIAVLNSVLTALGLWILGLGHYLAFLSTIVFLFSFVPMAGVFISSVPICLVALQYSGVQTMLLAVVMISVIHMVEAYILNPRIYGSHMRINPVIVLVILTIGGKLFQFWGLVLGVPLCTWFFSHAIRGAKERKTLAMEIMR